jgi:hypothetical protein
MLSFAHERIAYVKCALVSGDRACGGKARLAGQQGKTRAGLLPYAEISLLQTFAGLLADGRWPVYAQPLVVPQLLHL